MPDKERDTLPYSKAGIILSGDIMVNGGIQKGIIAPYTEGRFGDDSKYYVVPKGAIDPGEDVLEGALREATEETGIDMHKLLGDVNIQKLRNGEKVENCESGYEGVRIKRVAPTVLDYVYRGREDNRNHLAMFAIELEGLEKLRPFLKNQPNLAHELGRAEKVTYPTRTQIAEQKFPPYRERLDWVRQMRIPGKYTKGGQDVPLVPESISGDPKTWFGKLEHAYFASNGEPDKKIADVKDWQNFLHGLSHEDYERIRALSEQVKHEMKAAGLIGGDDALIKMDTKDSPLSFYQEGADILTARGYLRACLHSGMNRRDYARAFCGNTPELSGEVKGKQAAPRMERLSRSQFASVVWAVNEKGIEKVAEEISDQVKRDDKSGYDNPDVENNPAWMGGRLRRRDYQNTSPLGADLLRVHARMLTSEKPMTEIVGVHSHAKVGPASEELTLH